MEIKTEIQKQEKTTIGVMEYATFDGDMKTNLVTSTEIGEIVSSLFGTAFADYYGCSIRINNGTSAIPSAAAKVPNGAIYVELYFKDRGNGNKGSIKNLVPHGQKTSNKNEADGEKKGNNLKQRYFDVNAKQNVLSNGRVYDITNETYEALEEFMYTNNRNINWNEYTKEISTNMGVIGTKEEVIVCVSGLNLDKILTKIYGDKTDDGNYEYAANVCAVVPMKSNEFVIQVCQLSMAVVRKLNNVLCGYNNYNNFSYPQYK